MKTFRFLSLALVGLLAHACGDDSRSQLQVAGNPSPQINVVTIGDSYAAGEGNPAHLGTYDQFGRTTDPAIWWGGVKEQEAKRCHRSRESGHAKGVKAALNRIRSAMTIVDYQNFACSGARIDRGLLGPYEGAETANVSVVPDATWLPPQIAQVDEYYAKHKPGQAIDVLIVSISGNDYGFGTIIRECVTITNPKCTDMPRIKGFFEGEHSRVPGVKSKLDDLLTVLSQGSIEGKTYAIELSNGKTHKIAPIATMKTKVKKVVFVQYPNPVIGSNLFRSKYLCAKNLFEVGPDLASNLEEVESRWVSETALTTINRTIADAIRDNHRPLQKHLVTTLPKAFEGHGVCASKENRWINTNMDAERTQGRFMNIGGIDWLGASTGFVHPNNLGYVAMGEAIADVIAPFFEQRRKELVQQWEAERE